MTPDSHPPAPGGPSHVSSHTHRLAVGYLREDLSTDLGFDTVRLRLCAIAHGYILTRVMLADSPRHHPRLLTALLHDGITALLLPELDHLPETTRVALRSTCDIIAGGTVLPRLDNTASGNP
ncbi:hypothetical protein [Nocardia paucivorans]|uniref:hypothetical protein n=1 Tax=Nocardia paucivorans TaxID=114259 RepID=UPI0012FCE10D|nr:hypothetical protein [Nocardia paucivorans]